MTKTFDKMHKVLPEYYTTSEEMIRKGFPWAVVLSFHEVYRHLYPTDAYIKNYSVSDQDKPQYLLKLLENQLTLYSAIENSVLPYDNILNNISSKEENYSKEKHTHMLYGDLWEKLTLEDATVEPGNLLKKRINSPGFSFSSLKDKDVLDLGCGSGRYTIALSAPECLTPYYRILECQVWARVTPLVSSNVIRPALARCDYCKMSSLGYLWR